MANNVELVAKNIKQTCLQAAVAEAMEKDEKWISQCEQLDIEDELDAEITQTLLEVKEQFEAKSGDHYDELREQLIRFRDIVNALEVDLENAR